MTAKTWKETAAARRDARNVKVPDAATRPVSPKRDTKRWCKGKVGVEHQAKCFDYATLKYGTGSARSKWFPGWKVLACTVCGKELAHHYPFGKRVKVPEWAK